MSILNRLFGGGDDSSKKSPENNWIPDPEWSWVPGLPSFPEYPEMWALDPNPTGKRISEFGIICFVYPDDSAEFLANRYNSTVEIDPDSVLVNVTEEKLYTKIDGHVIIIKRFRLVSDASETEKETIPIPDDLTGVSLPPMAMEV